MYTRRVINKDLTHKSINPYSADSRYIYFFSDVHHLVKTIRNSFSNSFAHNNKRALWVSTCPHPPTHTHTTPRSMVNTFLGGIYLMCTIYRSRTDSGLLLLPKLKTEHLFLTSYSRMRVDLAAQVMFVYNTCVLMVPFYYHNSFSGFELLCCSSTRVL